MVRARTEGGVGYRRLAQRFRVSAGFGLALLLPLVARPTPRTLVAGAALAAVGLAIRAWASGFLRKNLELATAGPYTFTRNPLYLGTFILGAGVAVASGALWFVILFMALYLLIYVPVMQAEVETVRNLFPDEYDEYARHVPLFLPRLTPHRAPRGDRRFAPAQYVRHREYRAALGAALVFAVLAVKYYFLGAS